MKLSLNIGKRELSFSVGKAVASSLAQAFIRGDDTDGGGAQLRSAYQQSVWVYACVSTIAEQVAQIPFRFSRVQAAPIKQRSGRWRRKALGEDIVEGGALVELFNRPHPQLNKFQFWELVVSWLQLRGELFAVPVRGGRKVERLVVLSPDSFQEVVSANELIGWRYSAGPQAPLATQALLPEEVIFDRLASPYDFWRGLAPLAVAQLAAQTDYASAQFQKGLMLNNADTGVIVRTDQQLDETQRDQMLSALKERKRKAGTADRPLLLWGGAEVVKPTLSSTDMQYLENRKFNRQEICTVFKVPQELLGWTEDANRSVGESARLNFIENRIAPLCERLEAAFDPLIKSLDKSLWGWFDIEALPIMQAARRARYAGAVQAFAIGVPIDDCGEIFDLGLPDDLPHAGKSYLPFSLQEVGGENTQIPNDPNTQSEPAAGEEPKQESLFERAGRLLNQLGTRSTPPGAHACTLTPSAYLASIRGSVKNKTGKLQKFFFEQRGRVIAELDQIGKAVVKHGQNFCEGDAKALEDAFKLSSENAKLLAKFKPLLLGDLDFGGAQLFKEIGLSDFAVKPDNALAFLAQRKNEIENVNRFTFAALKQTLGDGLSQGETTPELTERVKSVFKDASERRAETIALTETNIAINAGRFDAMKTAKVDKKAWLASNLSGSRATHQQAGRDYADGIPLAAKFRVGADEMDFPGDPTASAGNVINCRCTSIAVKGGKACGPTLWLSWEEWLAAKEGTR